MMQKSKAQKQKQTPSRAYKACLHCRKRKSRCDLGEQKGPPCRRCKHELRECVIPEERAWSKTGVALMTFRPDDGNEGMSSTSPSKRQRLGSLSDSQIDPPSVTQEQRVCSSSQRPDLVNSVMQTVVTSGQDALGLLFQAADSTTDEERQPEESENGAVEQSREPRLLMTGECTAIHSKPTNLSVISDSAWQVWSASRFVKMGWLVPAEAVTYLDLFFKNMAPLSPVELSAYSGTDGHFDLVTKEPLLCCTILMISSRYHTLPGPAGISRGYFIHERFWHHCQHLIMRLVFGQEKGSSAKTRTLGSIEGLILMSEWNPRALHFPPEADGWDSDLLLTPTPIQRPSTAAHSKSIIDVIEPARRSDRMSWMLLGCALSLAHELDVFDDDTTALMSAASQAARVRKLLYISISQLAARQGSTSPLQHQHSAINNDASLFTTGSPSHEAFLQAWTELVKLFKSFSDMAFPSKSATKRLLRSGKYSSILEHFLPLLNQWGEKYIGSSYIARQMRDHLFIDYHYTQIYFSSLGMQAECEQVSADNTMPSSVGTVVDHLHAQQVISHCCALLERVVLLSEKGILRFAPVRIFLHATTASIFLLKALALGVRNSQLRSALTTLDNTVTALRTSVPDDIHLAHTYASLLKTHIWRLRKGFAIASSRNAEPGASRTQTPAATNTQTANDDVPLWPQHQQYHRQFHPDPQGNGTQNWADGDTSNVSPSSLSDWFALPFDPSMAPLFPVGGDTAQTPLSFEGDNLDFLWNFQGV